MTGLLVAEVFGPTVQGEGPSTGRRCGFVRLGLCNLDCSWCDTPYTWDWTRYDRAKELTRTTVDDVLDALEPMWVDRVVVTGGEPLVQRLHLAALVDALHDRVGYIVEVETNGTLDPGELADEVDVWNVSPKLAHSGVDRTVAWKPDVLRRLADTGHAAFKFVCRDSGDLDEVAELTRLAGIGPSLVWIMPEGTDPDTLNGRMADGLVDAAVGAGYNVTGRLHVQMWGNVRGR